MDPIWIVVVVLVAAAGVSAWVVAGRRRNAPLAPRYTATSADRTVVDVRERRSPADDRTVVGEGMPSDRTVVGVESAPSAATLVLPPAPPPTRPDETAATVVVRRGPRARLWITKGGTGGPFDLSEREYSMGRSSSSDIVVADPSVSGHHATLAPRGDGFSIRDLGSTNGTTVDGKDVQGEHPLRGGEVIGLGEATLRYERLGR